MTAFSRVIAGGGCALGLLALTACGGGESTLKPAALLVDGASAGPASLEDARGGFTLAVSPDSFLGAERAGSFTVEVSNKGDELVATIAVSGAQSLRALYCELAYDPEQYTPLGVEHLQLHTGTSADSRDEEMLTLSVLDRPGTVHIGQVLAHWGERAGTTGDCKLARVRFANRPFIADSVRVVSVALESVEVNLQLRVDSELKRLWWQHELPGDYNQDGLVGVSDLTPLGVHYEERGEIVGYHREGAVKYPVYAFDPGTLQRVVDGNGDGLIGVSDITEIGRSFGLQIEGYRVFGSPDLADYPGPDSAAALEVADIPVSMMGGQLDEQRYFRVPFPTLQSGWYYWLRPYNETTSGAASNYGLYAPALADDFELELQPETFFEGGQLSDVRLYLAEDEDQIVIDVWLEGAIGLKAFSGWLRFDPQQYRPTGLYQAVASRAGSVVDMSMAYLPAQLEGSWLVCVYGSLGNLDGYSGNWHACTLTLQRGIQDELTALRPDAASVYAGGNRPQYDAAERELSWVYPGAGDADQDGLVLTDDWIMVSYYADMWLRGLGTLGVDIPSHMDMNLDGLVTVSEISVIGNNHGNAIDGFSIYASLDPEDIPVRVAEDELHLLVVPEHLQIGHVAVSSGEGDALRERLRYRFQVPDPQAGQWLWLMPTWQEQVGNVVALSEIQLPEE